jgi:C4-type Zn-finger protein
MLMSSYAHPVCIEGATMSSGRQTPIEQVLQQIRADLPSAPQGMSDDEFDRLCNNIARAIMAALQAHEDRYHQLTPEFGEPQRPDE